MLSSDWNQKSCVLKKEVYPEASKNQPTVSNNNKKNSTFLLLIFAVAICIIVAQLLQSAREKLACECDWKKRDIKHRMWHNQCHVTYWIRNSYSFRPREILLRLLTVDRPWKKSSFIDNQHRNIEKLPGEIRREGYLLLLCICSEKHIRKWCSNLLKKTT